MKKFSNMSNSKVPEQPKNEDLSKDQKEYQYLKVGIIKLMDNYLAIRSYGAARTELLNGALSITGKEMFAEALINMIDDKSFNDQIKALESLKSINKDWESIDNRINSLYENINSKQSLSKMTNHINKIKSFLDLYSDDDRFESVLEKYSLRIKNSKEAYLRSIIASQMIEDRNYQSYSKEKLSQISDKFLSRSKDLGFENGES